MGLSGPARGFHTAVAVRIEPTSNPTHAAWGGAQPVAPFADFLRADNRVDTSPHADPLAPVPFWQVLEHENLKRPHRRPPGHALDVYA